MEKATVCKFLLMCGEKNGIKRYHCHRSGNFKSEGHNKRHLKTQGSKKIGSYCPAQIVKYKHEENPNLPIKVEFLSTHIGHENDLCHVTLSPNTKQMVAAKLLQKVPAEAIIDDVRDSVVSDNFERVHLLTNTDIYNIAKEFGITSEYQKDSNDGVSVAKFVTEMEKSNGRSSILYYKAQDTIDDAYPALKKEDFVLILMNQPQREMLLHYGNDVVSVDGTHGMSYDFQLYTLLVLDELREGFPCAFMISNREDTAVMTIYFSIIQQNCGQITPKVFMSDMAEQFANAWNAVMGRPKYELYCTWHVDNAWQKNLSKIKIVNDEDDTRDFAYKLLRTLLEELDQNKFHSLLGEAVNTLINDEKTADFGQYFKSNYADNFEKWAYCYRRYAGVNTNNHLERMHGTVKYIFLKGRKAGRLDKALFYLMKFIKTKLFNQVIVENKGKVSYKLRCLRKRHKTSTEMQQNLVTETTSQDGEKIYVVASSSGTSNYEVTKIPNPVHKSCKLLCNYCFNTCIHQYVCTCIDNVIKHNMCKHIHHVIQNQQLDKNCSDLCVTNDVNSMEVDDSRSTNEPAVVESIQNRMNEAILSEVKVTEDLSAADEYYAKGRSFCKDYSSCKFFVGEMKKIALKMECNFKAFSPTKCAKRKEELRAARKDLKPSRGLKLTPQKRLYSTKKKSKRSSKNKHQAPSSDAKDIICNSLILPPEPKVTNVANSSESIPKNVKLKPKKPRKSVKNCDFETITVLFSDKNVP
ncbi:uncharacterized protein LOC135845174 [Planococcus citri]|uniref:uncharacterized protein LOC135845174 n=1 Tax=Planococcus citri TaxID=170843 RepID=UPI0031F93B03